MLIWEIKKIIKSKSSIVIGILFILMILISIAIKPELETESSYINENGQYISDTRDIAVIANEKLLNKVSSIKDMIDKNNTSSDDTTKQKLSDISIEKINSDSGKEYKNIEFYKVFNFRINNIFISTIIILIIIIIFSNIYTEEKLCNVDSIILSSKNKNKVLYSKLVLSIITPIIIYGLYIFITGIITSIQFGFPINGELQAYRISEIPFMIKEMTINKYTNINAFTMSIIYISISVFSAIASYITQSSVEAVAGSTIFIILGKLFTLFRFLPKKILVMIGVTNYVDIIQRPENFIGVYSGNMTFLGGSIDISILSLIILTLIMITGILSTIYIFKKVIAK